MSEGAKKESLSPEKAQFDDKRDMLYSQISYQRDRYALHPLHWGVILMLAILTFGALLVLVLSYIPGIKNYIFKTMDVLLVI